MTEHRVPLLGERWRRFEEPQLSRDPSIRALVGQLQSLSGGPAPDPVFRAELRAQLVAIAPRVIAEGAEGMADETATIDAVPAGTRRQTSTPAHAPGRRQFRFGRVLGVAASLVVAFTLLLGGAVVLSRKAIPGDTLYGLKRASERVELATDSNDTDRANDLLRFASTRVDEVQQLINRSSATAAGPGDHAGALSTSTASLIRSTLGSANSDTASASRLLSTQAVHDGSATPLTGMTKWAPGQLARLNEIWTSLPDGSLRTLTTGSKRLVKNAQIRAQKLTTTVDCSCASGSTSDKLGPKPCTVCTAQNPSAPGRNTNGNAKSGTRTANNPGGSQGTSGTSITPVKPVKPNPVATSPAAPLGKAPTPTKALLPTLPNLPSLPITLPTKTKPVSVDSCGVTLNVLGLKVSLGNCSTKPTP